MTVVVTKMVNHCLRPVSSLPPSYLLTQCEVGLLHPPAALWTRQVVEDEWVGGLQGRVRETEDPNESGTSVITHWEFSFLPVIINLAAGGRPPQKNVTTGHKIQLVVMTGNESLIVLVLLEHTLLFTQLNFFSAIWWQVCWMKDKTSAHICEGLRETQHGTGDYEEWRGVM